MKGKDHERHTNTVSTARVLSGKCYWKEGDLVSTYTSHIHTAAKRYCTHTDTSDIKYSNTTYADR